MQVAYAVDYLVVWTSALSHGQPSDIVSATHELSGQKRITNLTPADGIGNRHLAYDQDLHLQENDQLGCTSSWMPHHVSLETTRQDSARALVVSILIASEFKRRELFRHA